MNEIVKKSRKPSANVEFSLPLSAVVKDVADQLELPVSLVRAAVVRWGVGMIDHALKFPVKDQPAQNYQTAIKKIVLDNLNDKARKAAQ